MSISSSPNSSPSKRSEDWAPCDVSGCGFVAASPEDQSAAAVVAVITESWYGQTNEKVFEFDRVLRCRNVDCGWCMSMWAIAAVCVLSVVCERVSE